MILDKETELHNAVSLTASGGTTNYINLRHAARHIGVGEPMAALVTLPTEPDETTGDETYTFKLQTDADVAFGTPTDLTPAITIPRTALTKDRFVVLVPPQTDMEKYLRGYFTLGGTTPVIAPLVHLIGLRDIPVDAVYADNVSIG